MWVVKYARWSGTADESKDGRFSGRREVAIGLGVYALYLLASRRKRGEAGRLAGGEERRAGGRPRAPARDPRRAEAAGAPAPAPPAARRSQRRLRRLERRADGRLADAPLRAAPPRVPPLPAGGRADDARCQPIFFLFPCAPPRSLDHFVDTIADVSGIDLDSGVVAQLYDPLAAMPSIHVAYAVVTAAGHRPDEREPGPPRARARLPAAGRGRRLRHREPLRPRRRRRRGRRRRRAPALRAQVTDCYLRARRGREADERPGHRRLEHAEEAVGAEDERLRLAALHRSRIDSATRSGSSTKRSNGVPWSRFCGKPSVRTGPGLTEWIRMPRGASSAATPREKASWACFEAAYGPEEPPTE